MNIYISQELITFQINITDRYRVIWLLWKMQNLNGSSHTLVININSNIKISFSKVGPILEQRPQEDGHCPPPQTTPPPAPPPGWDFSGRTDRPCCRWPWCSGPPAGPSGSCSPLCSELSSSWTSYWPGRLWSSPPASSGCRLGAGTWISTLNINQTTFLAKLTLCYADQWDYPAGRTLGLLLSRNLSDCFYQNKLKQIFLINTTKQAVDSKFSLKKDGGSFFKL